jgi:hypothetical protein
MASLQPNLAIASTQEPQNHQFGITAVAGNTTLDGTDLNSLVPGEPEVLKATLRNDRGTPVRLRFLNTSCGCTSAILSPDILIPGATATLNVSIMPGGPGPFQETVLLRFAETRSTGSAASAPVATSALPAPPPTSPEFEVTVPVQGKAIALFDAEPQKLDATIKRGATAPEFLLRVRPPHSPPVVEVLAEQDHVRFIPRPGPRPGTVAVAAQWNGLPHGAPAIGTARVITRTTQGTVTVAAVIPYHLVPDLPVLPDPARLDFDWTTPGTTTALTMRLKPTVTALAPNQVRLRFSGEPGPFSLTQPDGQGTATVAFSPTQSGFFRSTLVASDASKNPNEDLFLIPLSGGAP